VLSRPTLDQEKLRAILFQPVQAWEKQWVHPTSDTRHHLKSYLWVKSDRVITFEDENMGEEEEAMMRDVETVTEHKEEEAALITKVENGLLLTSEVSLGRGDSTREATPAEQSTRVASEDEDNSD